MRTAVIVALIPLVLFVLLGDCATFRYLEDARRGRVKADLAAIEAAIRKLAAAEKFTLRDWDQIDTPGMPSRIADFMEQGRSGFVDPWGNDYIIEKREDEQHIVVTLRSSHQVGGDVRGIELVISRADGKVIERRELWR